MNLRDFFCVVPLPSKPVTIRIFQHINIFSKRSRTKPLHICHYCSEGAQAKLYHVPRCFHLQTLRFEMTGRKLAMIFRQFFVVKKQRKFTRFLIFWKMVANPKKTMFNKIELFRIEDPSILVGDCYDLHFGHNQDEQER